MADKSTKTSALPSVAILGVGTMGSGMAHRLLTQNGKVTVYARKPEKRREFESAGANTADSPLKAVENAEIVISIVSDDVASREVWLGTNGALAGLNPDTVSLECSTISPDVVTELGKKFAGKSRQFLDAPVTGSKPQAAAGELAFLVGGDEQALRKAEPVLSVLGRKIAHLGPLGSGARMKLINNMLCAVQAAGLAEALALAEKSGLAIDSVLDILTNGAPGSPMVKTLSKRMMERNYDVNFYLRLMAKDVGYAIKLSEALGASHRAADSALDLLNNAQQQGWSDKDFSSLVEPLRF
ncbi:MAG: NAD(P)-dependent oxidoreductase [Bryobacteraceae bacterium]